MLIRSEQRRASAHDARISARKSHYWDFRAAVKAVVAKVRDGQWVTRGRQLHS
jgi:hypothetical protein